MEERREPPAGLPWYLLPDADQDRPLTPAEAAIWLRMVELGYPDPLETIERWAADSAIPKIKLGRRVAFSLRLLRAWLQSSTVPAKETTAEIQQREYVANRRGVKRNALVRESAEEMRKKYGDDSPLKLR